MDTASPVPVPPSQSFNMESQTKWAESVSVPDAHQATLRVTKGFQNHLFSRVPESAHAHFNQECIAAVGVPLCRLGGNQLKKMNMYFQFPATGANLAAKFLAHPSCGLLAIRDHHVKGY